MADREQLTVNEIIWPDGTVWTKGAAAPTAGTYKVGDTVWNTAPAANGDNMGWVCTAAGTPGTWKAFGSVAA